MITRTSLAFAFFGLAGPALAQGGRCDSVLRAAARDSVTMEVGIYFVGVRNADRIPDSLSLRVAQQVASAFTRPAIAGYPLFKINSREKEPKPHGFFTVTGEFRATWHRDGSIRATRLTATTLIPTLDSAVLRALLSVSGASLDRALPVSVHADSLAVAIRIAVPGAPPVSATLYEERFARREVTRMLSDARGNGAYQSYQMDAQSVGREGWLTLWFVVDARGRVMPSTVQVLHADDARMLSAAPAFVLRQRYRPAEIDRCPVPTLVIRRIDFKN